MSRVTICLVLIVSLFEMVFTGNGNKTEIKEPILKRPSMSKPVHEDQQFVPNENIHFGINNTIQTKFRPSPQVEEFYEYNKMAVAPAVAEAKNVASVSHQQQENVRVKHQNWMSKQEKPIRSESGPWVDLPAPAGDQRGWVANKGHFPATPNPGFNVRSQVYPSFQSAHETTTVQYPYVVTGSNNAGVTRTSGYSTLPQEAKYGYSGPDGHHSPSFEKEGPFGPPKGYPSSILSKTHYEHSFPVSAHEELTFPWKKVIKFLTAIIPIGLFLSALTPTVINVAPTNLTYQVRSRAEESLGLTREKLFSSLNYINKLESAECEEKVICELLLGAGSSHVAEKHITNLLDTFTQHERDSTEHIEALSTIQKAVKAGNCSTISCKIDLPERNKKT